MPTDPQIVDRNPYLDVRASDPDVFRAAEAAGKVKATDGGVVTIDQEASASSP